MALSGAVLLALPIMGPAAPPPELLDRAADVVALSREFSTRLTCIERVRSARFDGRGEASRERSDTFHWGLERGPTDRDLVAVRAKPSGRVVEGPDSHDWLTVVDRESRGWYRFDDLGATSAAGVAAHRVKFRGALPFDRGADVREWEGVLDLDPRTGRIVEIRASPSSQDERGIRRYDAYMEKTRWAITLFGGSLLHGRFGRRPSAARAEVRFQVSPEGTVLPGEVRHEMHRFARRGVAEIERVQVRAYEDCRRAEALTTAEPDPGR